MSTKAEIASNLEKAEQSVRDLKYEEVADSVNPVWDALKVGGDTDETKENFPSEILAKLARVLRKTANHLSIYGEESDEQYDQAQEVLKKAFAWHPGSEEVGLFNEQGMLFYDQGQYDKALKSFQQTTAFGSPLIHEELRVDALLGTGAGYGRLLRFSEAEDYFGQAEARLEELPSPPPNPVLWARLHIERGWLHFYQEQYGLSLSCFEKALEALRVQTQVDRNDEQEARAGQIASLQAEDTLDPDKPRDRAKLTASGQSRNTPNPDRNKDRGKERIHSWLASSPSGLSKKEALGILLTCGSYHSFLNNYHAALLAYELITREIGPENQEAWVERIDALKWLRRFGDAELVYKTAQKKLPKSIALWKEMADVYYQQKRFQESYDYYSGAALGDPANAEQRDAFEEALKEKDDEANEWTIVTLRKMRRLPEAETKVSDALDRFPGKVNILCEKAFIYYTERKYKEAIALFDRALKINEYYSFAYQWRAASLRKQGKFDDARKEIDEALAKLPMATYLWEELAWIAFDQNQFKEAEEYFARAIEIDPYLIPRRFSRVEVLLRLNRNDEALQSLLDLQAMFPNDIEVAEQLGWSYLRRGEMDLADERFSFIETQDSKNALGLNAWGGYHLKQRDYKLAAEDFRKAIEQISYEPQYHINLAWALVRQVKEPGEMPESLLYRRKELLDEARDRCREALKLDRFDVKAHICLGVIAFKRGAFADSEGYFRKSIDLSAAEGGHVELAALYVQMGRLDEAEKELTQAITRNNGDTRAHIESGNLKLSKGDSKDAIRECRIAVAVEPNSEEAHRALAIALMRDGQFEEAEKALRKVITELGSPKRWRLHLVLSQILIRLGDDRNKDKDDKKKDSDLYREALTQVYDALRTNPPPSADVFFHAGIAHYKLAEYPASRQSFDDCFRVDRDRLEAQRYSVSVQAMIASQKRKTLEVDHRAGGWLAIACLALLVLLWVFYAIGTGRTVPVGETEVAATTNANAAVPAGTAKATTAEERMKKAVDAAAAKKVAETSAAETAKVRDAASQEATKAKAEAAAATGNKKVELTKVSQQKDAEATKTANDAKRADEAKTAAIASSDEATRAAAPKEQREVLVDKSMLTLYTPILLGLIVVALLLPNLSKVTLPGGITADIREATVEISVGPRGDVGFGTSLPIISPGPG